LASFKGIISKTVCLSNTPEYELIKFRAKIPGKGSSESPRICVAVVRVNDSIIPLAAYTHGDTKREPEFHVLLERLVNILKVWKKHQQSNTSIAILGESLRIVQKRGSCGKWIGH
jgi:hypothetical protein